jgi:hypothetical protein
VLKLKDLGGKGKFKRKTRGMVWVQGNMLKLKGKVEIIKSRR